MSLLVNTVENALAEANLQDNVKGMLPNCQNKTVGLVIFQLKCGSFVQILEHAV